MNETVLSVFAAVLGAIVGSFLNACIHRMPRGIPLGNPRRSFCPSCNRSIPWYENLPILSWLLLRGKCSNCGAKISPRYLMVEALTAVLFFMAWQFYKMPLAPVFWLFLALLIAATFIDIEHFIIPDEITWGGTIIGIIISAALPQLMGVESHLVAAGLSLCGAALGFGLLWLIVEFGKLAFGKKRHAFPENEIFHWKRQEEAMTITLGEETLPWEEVFSRESDELVLDFVEVTIGEKTHENVIVKFRYDRLFLNSEEYPVEKLESFSGKVRAITIPREAMGFGDVKFIAAIGAFLGWQAVLFTICAASVIGCFAALAGLFLARDRAGSRVPFGPFLALGAIIWVFYGQALWNWYFGLFQPHNDFLN